MSYLEYNVKWTPTGPAKVLYFSWALALLLTATAIAPIALGFADPMDTRNAH